MEFESRRPVMVCGHGCVASSQPLASQIGLDILKAGGNAADAAVAVAAALNVTEPCSTGIGGDAFCLFYHAQSGQVKGLNGSGRSSAEATLSRLAADGFSSTRKFPPRHGHAVTVPGAAAAWVDTVEQLGSGKLSLRQILEPAITLATTGFPVQEVTATFWKRSEDTLQAPANRHGRDMLLNGRAPRHGEIITLPRLADTFKELASSGKEGFYKGRIAQAISRAVQEHGGLLTLDDLASHQTTFDEPISTEYRECRVWEMPPNGQGLTALLALNILEGFDIQALQCNSAEYLHLVIEAIKLGMADTAWYTGDPHVVNVPVWELLGKDYASKRRGLIDASRSVSKVREDSVVMTVCRARADVKRGSPVLLGSDTVYFCTADTQGNACSFINSNFMGFGTAIVPEGCGFTLQNRGYGFSLDPDHPNVLSPRKRPFHTIIPSMVTNAQTGELMSAFGVMGGFMQPQGHVQVLLNQLEFGMNPQQALDKPRICVGDSYSGGNLGSVVVEQGIQPDVIQKLRDMGHNVTEVASGHGRAILGRGQVITRGAWWDRSGSVCRQPSVYWAGSDPRADGIVAGY
ncbi:hypothetical protein BaRGS_00001149 [Batillaria attramentaria]|uniref:Gamma-glutamyltransferase n=1 Tax=Batillaria attramentaria TaxID=370345 RepID=A0ABD0M5J2_9CAEN